MIQYPNFQGGSYSYEHSTHKVRVHNFTGRETVKRFVPLYFRSVPRRQFCP
jgi:hypothetical protein